MEDFKPNSHRFKEENKLTSEPKTKLEKVVTGPVKVKKKSEIKKLSDVFLAEDMHTVKTYLVMDVLIPALKNTIEDIVTNGIRMILRGETTSKNRFEDSRTPYGSFFNRGTSLVKKETRRPHSVYSYQEVSYTTRGEAEAVLNSLCSRIRTYGIATVADFYELSGIRGEHTDNKYGWSNLDDADVERTRDGYSILLPRAMPID